MSDYIINRPDIGCFVQIFRGGVPKEIADDMLILLKDECTTRYSITVYGNTTMQPRTNVLYADDNISYMHYSTVDMPAKLWNPQMDYLRNFVSQGDFHPNSCLVNGYIEPKDRVGLHRDKEMEGNNTVCTVSFGGTRRFVFKPYKKSPIVDQLDVHDVELYHGDIVYMYGNTNIHYEHEIPAPRVKDTFDKSPRYSATFRQIPIR